MKNQSPRSPNPLTDSVFKALFTTKQNANLLVHLINAIIQLPPHRRIISTKIQNPSLERLHPNDKLTILDIKAQDDQKRLYQIEIQRSPHPHLRNRIRYTAAALLAHQLEKGQNFDEITPTISIWLLENTLDHQTPHWHHRIPAEDIKTGFHLCKESAIHVIELKKWPKPTTIKTELDRWLYFLRDGTALSQRRLPQTMQTHEMRQAMSTLRRFHNQSHYAAQYRLEEDNRRVENLWTKSLQQAETRLAQESARANEQEERANAQEERANAQEALAKKQQERANAQEAQAQAEKARAEAYRAKLLKLGLDPDDL